MIMTAEEVAQLRSDVYRVGYEAGARDARDEINRDWRSTERHVLLGGQLINAITAAERNKARIEILEQGHAAALHNVRPRQDCPLCRRHGASPVQHKGSAELEKLLEDRCSGLGCMCCGQLDYVRNAVRDGLLSLQHNRNYGVPPWSDIVPDARMHAFEPRKSDGLCGAIVRYRVAGDPEPRNVPCGGEHSHKSHHGVPPEMADGAGFCPRPAAHMSVEYDGSWPGREPVAPAGQSMEEVMAASLDADEAGSERGSGRGRAESVDDPNWHAKQGGAS